ncbi:MAG: metallophosphoesterase [Clostridia bacterium]|nr:metallophosphoesterase [Clostridia bacterium]
MKKRKIVTLILMLALLVGALLAVAIPASASTVTESDWIAKPNKELVKCTGDGCTHENCYEYSFIAIGDTQNLNYIDVTENKKNMYKIYDWIASKKTDYNIQYVLELGDVTQSWHRGYKVWDAEWERSADAHLALENAGIPYSIVRGNHDLSYFPVKDADGNDTSKYSGLNVAFGKGTKYYADLEALTKTADTDGPNGEKRYMAGFLNPEKIEDTYRKHVVKDADGNVIEKYIIFTLDWHPTEECLVWLDEILKSNPEYTAIITIHSYIYRDATTTDIYEDTFPQENIGIGSKWEEVSSTGGQVHPKVLWETVLAKYENVKMVLCGHVDEDDIKVSQLRGDQGNTVTNMLIDGQTIDKNIEPVGLVAVFYIAPGGKVMNVEYVSTVRAMDGKAAYLKEKNQFEIVLDPSDEDGCGWTETPHGNVPTDMYESYPFHVLLDDDSDESTDAFYYGSYSTWEDTLKGVHDFSRNGSNVTQKKAKTYYIVMSEDYTDDFTYTNSSGNLSGIHNSGSAGNYTRTILDLCGNKLTLATAGTSSNVFLPFYTTTSARNPRYAITNGDIVITGTSRLAVTQSGPYSGGQKAHLELSKLNITYEPAAGVNPQPLISNFSHSGTISNISLDVFDCNIDFSKVTSAFTLFNLYDQDNNNYVSLTLKGGSIKGNTVANTTLFTKNSPTDKITFAKNSSGAYTKVTMNDSGTLPGVYYSDIKDTYYELGAAVASGSLYEYPLVESAAVLTEYGEIPADKADTAVHPFVLFKNGELKATFSDWGAFLNDTMKTTADLQSGCTLLLRADHTTDVTSTDHLDKINDLTIDLGGHTLARGKKHLFNAIGTSAKAKSTKITVKNGTLAAVGDEIISFNDWASSGGLKNFEFIFDGITIDVSHGQGICIVFGGGKIGSDSKIILNNCTINRGSTTSSLPLFNMNDPESQVTPGTDKNLDDVHVYINGGTLIADSTAGFTLASFDEERVAGEGSPDTIELGKGKDGKYLTFKLPLADKDFTATANITAGKHYLVKNSEDASFGYYTLDNLTTEYGDITTAYASVAAYPFAVFHNGAFKTAYATYKAAMNGAVSLVKTADKATDTVHIVMRRDYDAPDKDHGYFSSAMGNIILDLGGYTLSTANAYIASMSVNYSEATESYLSFTSKLLVKNGTLVNNRSALPIFGVDQSNTSALGVAKKVWFGFENVTFKAKSDAPIASFNKTTELGIDATVYAKNCTFDLTSGAASHINFSNGTTRAKVELIGCNVIASNYNECSIATLGSDDTLLVGKDGGVYLTVTQTQNTLPTATFNTNDGGTASFYLASTLGGKYVYELGANEETEYGTITPQYSNIESYPVALFSSDKSFIGGYSDLNLAYAEILNAPEKSYVILVRRDMDKLANKSIGNTFTGSILIDLGGHTVTIASDAGNYFLDVSADANTTEGLAASFAVKNGSIVKAAGRAVVCVNYRAGLTEAASYSFNFENVKFLSTYSGFSNPNVVFTTWEDGYLEKDGVAAATDNVYVDSEFTDCIFDMSNSIDGAVMLNLTHSTGERDRVIHTVKINGGKILADSADDFTSRFAKCDTITPERTDTVTYGKVDGGSYTELKLPLGAEAPAAEYNGLIFAKLNEDEETVTYRLTPMAAADANFIPKLSVTLDSDLILNVYIPEGYDVTSLNIEGEAIDLDTMTPEDGYYVYSNALKSFEAAKKLMLTVELNWKGTALLGEFSLSVTDYAKTVINGSYTDAEKTLAKDMLSYVRACYTYFAESNTADETERVTKLIDEIIGEGYDDASSPDLTKEAKKPSRSSFDKVTFYLGETPSFRFYYTSENAPEYTYKIGEYDVAAEVNAEGKYVDVKVYAYQLTEDLTFTYGENTFTYNVYSYYSEAKEEVKPLVERLIKYSESAKAYRDSVINPEAND